MLKYQGTSISKQFQRPKSCRLFAVFLCHNPREKLGFSLLTVCRIHNLTYLGKTGQGRWAQKWNIGFIGLFSKLLFRNSEMVIEQWLCFRHWMRYLFSWGYEEKWELVSAVWLSEHLVAGWRAWREEDRSFIATFYTSRALLRSRFPVSVVINVDTLNAFWLGQTEVKVDVQMSLCRWIAFQGMGSFYRVLNSRLGYTI